MKAFLTSFALNAALLCAATTAHAQAVMDCDWQASAMSIVEPWEEYSRTFSNSAVRLAALDTIEPAVGFAYILVLSPPYDELGIRQCKVIGQSEGLGYAGLMWDALEAEYDPERGLVFQVPVVTYVPDLEVFPVLQLEFSVNQSTGEIVAKTEPTER